MRGLLGLARSHLSAARAVVIKRTFNGFKPNVSCEENAVSQRSRSSNGTRGDLRLTHNLQYVLLPRPKVTAAQLPRTIRLFRGIDRGPG